MTSVPGSSNELPTNITPLEETQNKSKTEAPVDLNASKTHKVFASELNAESTASEPEIHSVKSIPAGTNLTQPDASLSVIKTAVESIQLEKKDMAAKDPQIEADESDSEFEDPELSARLEQFNLMLNKLLIEPAVTEENQNKSKEDAAVNQKADKTHKVAVSELTTGATEGQPEIHRVKNIPIGVNQLKGDSSLAVSKAAIENIQSEGKDIAAPKIENKSTKSLSNVAGQSKEKETEESSRKRDSNSMSELSEIASQSVNISLSHAPTEELSANTQIATPSLSESNLTKLDELTNAINFLNDIYQKQQAKLEALRTKISTLTQENEGLRTEIGMIKDVTKFSKERGVLNNQREIEEVLSLGNAIPSTTNEVQNKSKDDVVVNQNKDNQKEVVEKSLVSPSKSQSSLIKRLILQPAEVRKLILRGLSVEELISLEIALSSSNLEEWQKLTVFVRNVRFQIILDNILANHPEWKNPIAAWKTVSIEDTVWLLRLYDLLIVGLDFPQITNLYPKLDPSRFESEVKLLNDKESKLQMAAYLYRQTLIPSERTPELLKQKSEIEKILNSITSICIPSAIKHKKFPEGFSLLINLKRFCVHGQINLKTLPNISENTKLEELHIENTPLDVLPNLKYNKQLKKLILRGCGLKIPPNLSQNPNLKELDLSNNQIQQAPNLNQNNILANLFLGHNQLSIAPDTSHNPNLEQLELANNRLTAPPIIGQKQLLNLLALQGNPLDKTTYPQIAAIVKQHPQCEINVDPQCVNAIVSLLKNL